MATLNDILGYAEGLADAGTGVSMSKWGMQCAALPNAISTYFFGKTLWGNAIDLLNSARDLGYEVEYNQEGNADSKPRAGAVFVQETTYLFGHSYGHTGLVIEDSDGYTMRTIEQNIDGNEDSLYVGGPARYNTRDFTAIVGWFYFPVDGKPAQVEPITPSEPLTVNSSTFNEVAVYTAGQEINYDGWLDNDGYIWITYIGASGNRRYVAVGQSENGQRVTDFGSFA